MQSQLIVQKKIIAYIYKQLCSVTELRLQKYPVAWIILHSIWVEFIASGIKHMCLLFQMLWNFAPLFKKLGSKLFGQW